MTSRTICTCEHSRSCRVDKKNGMSNTDERQTTKKIPRGTSAISDKSHNLRQLLEFFCVCRRHDSHRSTAERFFFVMNLAPDIEIAVKRV